MIRTSIISEFNVGLFNNRNNKRTLICIFLMYFGINDNTNEIEENTYYDNVELYGIAETIQEILITSGTPPDYYALTTQTISDIPYLAMGNLNFSGTGDITAEIKSSLSEAITKCKLKFKT